MEIEVYLNKEELDLYDKVKKRWELDSKIRELENIRRERKLYTNVAIWKEYGITKQAIDTKYNKLYSKLKRLWEI